MQLICQLLVVLFERGLVLRQLLLVGVLVGLLLIDDFGLPRHLFCLLPRLCDRLRWWCLVAEKFLARALGELGGLLFERLGVALDRLQPLLHLRSLLRQLLGKILPGECLVELRQLLVQPLRRLLGEVLLAAL